MHFQSSAVLTSLLALLAHAAPGTVLTSRQLSAQDVIFGPNQFCMGLSRGGDDACFQVPEGCFVVRPVDNTIPSPICADGSAQDLQSIS